MPTKTNKLIRKRARKEKFFRSPAFRPLRKRVLVVCEGGKTEPNYFRFLIAKLGLTTAEVKICGKSGSAPQSIVKHGKEILKLDPDYEFIFFVFDRDSHTGYKAAIQSIKNMNSSNKSFTAITSNPCFEIWFLMHFRASTAPFSSSGNRSSCDNVISKLKQCSGFGNYKKGGKEFANLLENRRQDAKKHSRQVYNNLMASRSVDQTKHDLNPVTLVHELVETLEQLAKN